MNTQTHIRPAQPTEAGNISALALRSKAYWGYPEEQMAVFRKELTVTDQHIVPKRTHVLEADGIIVGFYTLVAYDPATIELEHLFIEPTQIRHGYGSQLFWHAAQIAQQAAFRLLVIQSDPHASGFYTALGARLTREIPSSIPSRVIPYFELDLTEPKSV